MGLGLLTNELTDVFTKTLLSSVIKLDKADIEATVDGGIRFELQQKLGEKLSVAYKGSTGGAQESQEARFDFRITENWSMEGLASRTFSTSYNVSTYSATLRYRVPLESFQEFFGL